MSDGTIDFVGELGKTVVAIMAPVIAGLVTAVLVQVLRRLGFVLEAEKQAKTEHLVEQAVLRAEEWGAKRLKAQIATTGTQKLDRAVADVVAKDKTISAPEAVAQIEAMLPKLELGASSPTTVEPVGPFPPAGGPA